MSHHRRDARGRVVALVAGVHRAARIVDIDSKRRPREIIGSSRRDGFPNQHNNSSTLQIRPAPWDGRPPGPLVSQGRDSAPREVMSSVPVGGLPAAPIAASREFVEPPRRASVTAPTNGCWSCGASDHFRRDCLRGQPRRENFMSRTECVGSDGKYLRQELCDQQRTTSQGIYGHWLLGGAYPSM